MGKREMAALRTLAIVTAIGFSVVLLSMPIVLNVVTFSVATANGVSMTASTAFTTIALFSVMRFPFAFFPFIFQQWIVTTIALKRVQNFLLLDELESGDNISGVPEQDDVMIEFKDASLSWNAPEEGDADHKLTLQNVNLSVKRGELVAVVGSVGSGKSTLVAGILRELYVTSGSVRTRGSCAYCGQQPWIMNTKLKHNVTFGLPFDQERYNEAVRVSCLEADLDIIKGGSEAEIGERGITLSGGQKARVALARAVYRQADVYVLDDPLSAVDAHVGRSLLEGCIRKTLADRGKTVLLVTNALQYLSQCDRIAVIEDQTIKHLGTYDELREQGVDLTKELQRQRSTSDSSTSNSSTSNSKEDNNPPETTKNSQVKTAKKKKKVNGDITEEEERSSGDVDRRAYWYYFRSSGIHIVALFLVFQVLARLASSVDLL